MLSDDCSQEDLQKVLQMRNPERGMLNQRLRWVGISRPLRKAALRKK
jgi:hypothetical protein